MNAVLRSSQLLDASFRPTLPPQALQFFPQLRLNCFLDRPLLLHLLYPYSSYNHEGHNSDRRAFLWSGWSSVWSDAYLGQEVQVEFIAKER